MEDNGPQYGRIEERPEANEPVPTWTSCRYLMALIGLYCFTIVYMVRINLSVAMVCMVAPLNVSDVTDVWDNGTVSESCSAANISDKEFKSGTIPWEKSLQGTILSSFFYGYMVMQLLSGWLAEKYGGKRVMMVGMSLSCICTFFTPVAVSFQPESVGLYLLLALRVILGLATAVSFPSMHALWGKWAPELERTKLMAFCYAGTMVGNVVTLSASGVLCVYGFGGGWPSIFYISAMFNFVLLILWWFLIYDSPAEHPRISNAEKLFIQDSIGDKVEQKIVPWRSIFTSPPVYALTVAHFCMNWGNYTLLTSLPAYMKEVLKFDIKSNGFLSALPYICMFVAALLFGYIADLLRQNTSLSTTVVRKIFQTLAQIIPAIFMVSTGAMTCDTRATAVFLLTTGVAFTSLCRSGYLVNHVDLAPRYAGILFGITNTIGTVPGMVAPKAVSSLTPNGLRSEWQTVFYIWGAVYVFGAIVYCVFGSGEKQPWAMDEPEDSETKNDSTEMDEIHNNERETLSAS